MKTRFAPSPTGTPHVGLIRTALYNWAYARNQGGSFLFRIEDTDTARNTDESFESILEAFRWLGIDSDEGIVAGGGHGPYRQSERVGFYDGILRRMLENGLIYESFSTREEIEARNLAAGRSKETGYDNFDRDLSIFDRSRLKAQGVPYVYRVRVPDEAIEFEDLVRGKVSFPAGSFPDFAITRPDGSHLYPFVNAVDDALMGVTHVLRGEDLLSSTPRQLVIYRALIKLGITEAAPVFGHMPYIMGEDGKKLSKRNPKSNLFNLRDEGYIPAGLLNYLALLGWGLSASEDVFTMDEMVKAFDIRDVNASPSRFDEKKARAINAEHIRRLTPNDFLRVLGEFIGKHEVTRDWATTAAAADALAKIAPSLQTRIQVLGDAIEYVKPLMARPSVPHIDLDGREQLRFARGVLADVPEADFHAAGLDEAFAVAMVENPAYTHKSLWRPVRLALTGAKVSLPTSALFEALGKAESITRLGVLS